MKSTQIKIDQELNRYIWEKGKTNPPRKVRVRITKDEDDQVIVSLYEDILLENESREKSEEANKEDLENKYLVDSDSDTNTKTTISDSDKKTTKT